MNESDLNKLVQTAAKTAMSSAAKMLMLNKVPVTDYDAAGRIVGEEVKAVINEAIEDFKQASECGMHAVGQASFGASMVNAGIKAARRIEAEVRQLETVQG